MVVIFSCNRSSDNVCVGTRIYPNRVTQDDEPVVARTGLRSGSKKWIEFSSRQFKIDLLFEFKRSVACHSMAAVEKY